MHRGRTFTDHFSGSRANSLKNPHFTGPEILSADRINSIESRINHLLSANQPSPSREPYTPTFLAKITDVDVTDPLTSLYSWVEVAWDDTLKEFYELENGMEGPFQKEDETYYLFALETQNRPIALDSIVPMLVTTDKSGNAQLFFVSMGASSHYVITDCDGGATNIVKVKPSEGPGSTVELEDSEDILAYLESENMFVVGDDVTCEPYRGLVEIGGVMTNIPLHVCYYERGRYVPSEDLAIDQLELTEATSC